MAELGFNIPSLIAYLVNFLILLGVLFLFAYKPVLRALDARSDRIRESLEAADRVTGEFKGLEAGERLAAAALLLFGCDDGKIPEHLEGIGGEG